MNDYYYKVKAAKYCIAVNEIDNISIYHFYKIHSIFWEVVETSYSKEKMKMIRYLYGLSK